MSNIVSMDRHLALPALLLLDEVGAGTDPVEGGALGVAIIEYFRARGALVVATTHDDVLKSYAVTTSGVACAGFGFDPETFAPNYTLTYGSPGRSLALEIAARTGRVPYHHRGRSESPQRPRVTASRSSGQGRQRHARARGRARQGGGRTQTAWR